MIGASVAVAGVAVGAAVSHTITKKLVDVAIITMYGYAFRLVERLWHDRGFLA